MNETMREKLFGIVDEVLTKAGVLDITNAILEANQAEELLSERYNNILKDLENKHEQAPEERKELSEETIKNIKAASSKENFVTRVINRFKTDMAILVLEWNLMTTEESWNQEFEVLKERFKNHPEEYAELLSDAAGIEEKDMMNMYLDTTYAGYIPEGTPECVVEFLKEMILPKGGVIIPHEVVIAGKK